MTSDQRRAVELISIAEKGAPLSCEHTLRGNVHVKVAGHSWAVGNDDAVTIIRPDGRITDYAALEYELSPEGQRDLCDHHRRCAEAEAPDLLPELHDLTDLDTDRDTERAADERDRAWEELNVNA